MTDIYSILKDILRTEGIVDVGVANTESWGTNPLVSSTVPFKSTPKAIMPDGKSVLSFGIPVQQTILDTAPSIYYNKLYGVINQKLDSIAQRIVMELEIMGYNAIFIPRDGYHGVKGLEKEPTAFFSHKHAAYLAGLGNFGVNNTILSEKYGPRIRFTSVITDAILPYDDPCDKEICIKCMRCAKSCPSNAIGSDVYPNSRMDKIACTKNSIVLAKQGISPCGKCIAVCPVGKKKIATPAEEAVDNIRSYLL